MQYSAIIFSSILAALVSASPAIDPLTVTSLSPAQVSISHSSPRVFVKKESIANHVEHRFEPCTVTIINKTETICTKPSHWLYTRNYTFAHDIMDKPQLHRITTPAASYEAVPASRLSITPAPSLAKRQRDYTEVHVVTYSSPHLVSVHTRPRKTTTQDYFHRDPSTNHWDYMPAYDTTITTWLIDHLETTSRVWNVQVTLYTTTHHSSFNHFAATYSITTVSDSYYGTKVWTTRIPRTWLETSTYMVPYTTAWTLSAAAPPAHITLLSQLADIAFSGSEWERVRYTSTCSRPTTVEVYVSNTISGAWTEARTWYQPYATKTWISYHPNFITAYASAEAAYLASLTGDPAFNSLVMELATDSSALDAFTSAAAALATLSPGESGAIAGASSVIAGLPSPAASFYNSVLSQDIAIASSVVNNIGTSGGSAAASSTGLSGTGKTSATKSATGTAANAATSGTAASTSSTGAAPTNVVVKAAGVALGVFGAAVAML